MPKKSQILLCVRRVGDLYAAALLFQSMMLCFEVLTRRNEIQRQGKC
jgi:hypothetical protein